MHVRFLAALALIASLGVSPAAAQQNPGGWQPGPAAGGDNTYAGAIDAPVMNARVTSSGTFVMAGWFVDRSAEGWAGADDVEIFLGSMGNGGALLAHALFTESRPDVAQALGNPYWVASGWSAIIPADALPVGSNTLSVYVHTPSKGWWFREVPVTVPPRLAGSAQPTSQLGFDISFPQCGAPGPIRPAFSIIGVNGGLVFSSNPCLARHYAWALTSTSPTQPHVSFYMNTGNPGPEASERWRGVTVAGPRPCDGSWSSGCAYNYGWAAAQDAFARARAVAGPSANQVPWWLDVEIANSWAPDKRTNVAALEGTLDGLRSAGIGSIGIYALAADWEEITGAESASSPINAPFANLPNWRPGAQSAAEAPSWCSRSVTGGRVKYVQYAVGPFDGNYPCY
jgi:hypothetical protein